jgi:hypothetical protein
MKILTALAAAAAATVIGGTQAFAADMPPSPYAITCLTIGATWVAGQQVVPALTVCVPTP